MRLSWGQVHGFGEIIPNLLLVLFVPITQIVWVTSEVTSHLTFSSLCCMPVGRQVFVHNKIDHSQYYLLLVVAPEGNIKALRSDLEE